MKISLSLAFRLGLTAVVLSSLLLQELGGCSFLRLNKQSQTDLNIIFPTSAKRIIISSLMAAGGVDFALTWSEGECKPIGSRFGSLNYVSYCRFPAGKVQIILAALGASSLNHAPKISGFIYCSSEHILDMLGWLRFLLFFWLGAQIREILSKFFPQSGFKSYIIAALFSYAFHRLSVLLV